MQRRDDTTLPSDGPKADREVECMLRMTASDHSRRFGVGRQSAYSHVVILRPNKANPGQVEAMSDEPPQHKPNDARATASTVPLVLRILAIILRALCLGRASPSLHASAVLRAKRSGPSMRPPRI